MKKLEAAKHQVVRDALTEAIRRGDFKPGDRLPAERNLAEIYGVSYMTARRAVTEMVEADLLLRRARSGTYVPNHTPRHVASTTLRLVCPAFDSSSIRAFVNLGTSTAEARGWRADVIRLHGEQVRPAVRAIETGDPTIVLPSAPELEGPLQDALIKAEGRAVVLGNRLDQAGVPSIMADDAQGIQLAMDHLKAMGHRFIAVVSDHPQHPVDRVQLEAWQANLPGDLSSQQKDDLRVIVDTPRHAAQSGHTYVAVKEFLENDGGQTTALLCLIDEMALPAMAACRDSNRSIPEKISFVASGNGPTMLYAHPPVTSIDVHMERHIALAMELLDDALDKRPQQPLLRLVTPHLVERQSVARAE